MLLQTKPATTNDLPQIKEIIDLSFPRFFRFFASKSLGSEGIVLVSQAADRIVGFAKLIEFMVGDVKGGCVLWLGVHPDHRRKGIASALINAATVFLKGGGVKSVFASAQHGNFASLGAFGKAGFFRIGFWGLWGIFGWRVLVFYRKIWFFPGEVVVCYS